MDKYAIIGTAGRDKTKPMTYQLWKFMIKHAWDHIPKGQHVVSGGAAWADHLAVFLFLEGHAKELTLYLPAPIKDGWFDGPYKSAGSAANFYHGQFSAVVGYHSIGQIELAAREPGCHGEFEPSGPGYGALFARNAKVAADCDHMLAYTFGRGTEPADGGTKDTWDKASRLGDRRIHVPLPELW